MKKVIILLMLVSCEPEIDDNTLSNMKSPVVIIGVSDNSISVKDSLGQIRTFYNSGLQLSLSHRHIFDTIK